MPIVHGENEANSPMKYKIRTLNILVEDRSVEMNCAIERNTS